MNWSVPAAAPALPAAGPGWELAAVLAAAASSALFRLANCAAASRSGLLCLLLERSGALTPELLGRLLVGEDFAVPGLRLEGDCSRRAWWCCCATPSRVLLKVAAGNAAHSWP